MPSSSRKTVRTGTAHEAQGHSGVPVARVDLEVHSGRVAAQTMERRVRSQWEQVQHQEGGHCREGGHDPRWPGGARWSLGHVGRP